MTVVGVDVGAHRIHCAAIDDSMRVTDAKVIEGEDIPALARWARGASVVAVDAPAQLSRAPHRDDQTLSPKFRLGRCAEIALARNRGIWVPWVSPVGDPTGWIAVGLEIFGLLRAAEIATIEVYPYAAFRSLASGELPPKSRPSGLAARAEVLRRSGVTDPSLALWSHDGLDALMGAVVALDYVCGRADRVTCGHDGSTIWLPERPVA